MLDNFPKKLWETRWQMQRLAQSLCMGWCEPGSGQVSIRSGLGRNLTLTETAHEPSAYNGVAGMGWNMRW